MTGRIRPRERDAVVAALRAGVVPRSGLQHVQVGRAAEVRAVLADLTRICDGGASVRFVIGEFGSGKTFFLHLARSIALEKRLVTMQVDLTPDRRLHGGGGRARALYAALTRSTATRARPEGGALGSIVDRFVTDSLDRARKTGTDGEEMIRSRLAPLDEAVGGYDFAQVLAQYWRGYNSGDDQLTSNAVRWLRGEFTTRAQAREALGVRTIVDDTNWYDHLVLLARFVRLAGFEGLLICLDEMVNLYKLSSTRARASNYEQVLRILNDSLQGSAEHLGFVFGGTPEFLLDTRRGLFSYPALATRLAENSFATDHLVDRSGPVLRLGNLSPEDMFVLLTRLRHLYASGDPEAYLVPDEALTGYLQYCSSRLGDAWFRTPRATVKGFLDLLALLEQYPDLEWGPLLGRIDLTEDRTGSDVSGEPDPTRSDGSPADGSRLDDELTAFRL
ncbi:MAG: hypothetical protein QG608_417 [Actinomycetota bacterium]|nr:hypothetical protein [Actinomycetota bacterium]